MLEVREAKLEALQAQHAKQQEERFMRKIMGKILHLKLAIGFDLWNQYVKQSRKEEDAKRKIMAKILYFKQSIGFDVLRKNVADCNRQEELMLNIMGRVLNFKLWAGFNQLCQHVAHCKKTERAMAISRRVVLRALHVSLVRGWRSWTLVVQQSKQDERLAAIEARQEHMLMRKVMRRVLHCKHWAGFNRLRQNVADCKQMERLMRKVLQRAKNLKLAMGFNRLQYNIRHHKDKRLLRVTVVRWCRIRLLQAFRTLAHQVVL